MFPGNVFAGNEYTRYLTQQNIASPTSGGSQGNTSGVHDTRHVTSQHRPLSTGPVPAAAAPPGAATSPAAAASPAASAASPPQPPTLILNNLTIDELLDSPARQHLIRLDPKRPPGTLWFDDDGKVAATVRSIFEKDFKEPHANWTQTPRRVIDRWYETFAQTYNWDRSINNYVKMEFEKKLKKRMSDQVCRWKSKWKENGDEAKPKWVAPDVWAALVRYWCDPKSVKKSTSCRNARYHDPEGTGIHKHRSGQTSFKARARRHSEKTGDSIPDFLLVLEETHRKPDGSFIDGKSESIYNEVSSKIQDKVSGSEDNMESLSIQTKNRIYAEVAPKKKNIIYGIGSLQHDASSACCGTPPPPTGDQAVLAQKLAEAEIALATQAAEMKTTKEELQITRENLQTTTEKVHSFDILFDYLAEKDPDFAAKIATRTTTRTQPGCNQTTLASASASATATATGTCMGADTGTATTRESSLSQTF